MKIPKLFSGLSVLQICRLQISSLPFVYSSILPKRPIPMYPICKDCKFFIADTSKCARMYDIDNISGKVSYQYASIARLDHNVCGTEGKLFEKNEFKYITRPYYILKNYFPIFIVIGFYVYIISKK